MVIGKVDFGHGARPQCPVFGPNGLAAAIPTGQAESHMLAITRDGRRGYTANVGPGTVSVLDLEAKETLEVAFFKLPEVYGRVVAAPEWGLGGTP
jgi:hypothetical protein